MKKLILIFVSCLCLAGCKKNQFHFRDSETSVVQNKTENRTVKNFEDSLKQEKYINTYKELALFLWDKNDFIAKNYDTINENIKAFKLNEIIGPGTAFNNNELLADSSVKIGMNKDEVYKLLGTPERLLSYDNKEVYDYSYSMYVPDHNKKGENFYAATGVEVTFDENQIVTKVFLLVEWIEEPIVDSDLF